VERLLGQARLLTLLGPGGTGKTRLAMAAAERLPDACWFVALDACPEPELVARAVAGRAGRRRAGVRAGAVLAGRRFGQRGRHPAGGGARAGAR